jgi:hypothetical protein
MSAFSNKMEADIVNYFLRNQQAVTPAETLYLALFTDDPGESGYANEATYDGYARQVITFREIDGSGNTSNDIQVTFPANTGIQQVIADAAVYDSPDYGTGNQILHGGLSAPKTLDENDVLSFADGALVLNID